MPRSVRNWFGLVALMLLLTACAPWIVAQEPHGATATGAALAPDFHLYTLAGDELGLSDLRGRWVLINFWATWCLPCREEMPYLQKVAATHADHLTVLGINMREAAPEIQPFLDELGITFPILLQPDNETLLAYNIRGLPLTFLVDPQGELILRQAGPLQPAAMDVLLVDLLPRQSPIDD